MEYNLKKDYNKLKIYIVNSKVASNITKQTIIVNNPAKERRLNHKNAKRWQKKKTDGTNIFLKIKVINLNLTISMITLI